MKLSDNIDGLVKNLAKSNARLANRPWGPTILLENGSPPHIMTARTIQMIAKTLIEHFGSIEAVNSEIERMKFGEFS